MSHHNIELVDIECPICRLNNSTWMPKVGETYGCTRCNTLMKVFSIFLCMNCKIVHVDVFAIGKLTTGWTIVK